MKKFNDRAPGPRMSTRSRRSVTATLRSATLLLSLTGLAAPGLTGCGGNAQASEDEAPPPPTVTVAEPVTRDVTLYYQYSGNLASVDAVELRARVAGLLEQQHFTASTAVSAGQRMFTIEPAPYQIAVEAAQAAVEREQALVDTRTIEAQRINDAFDQQAASLEEKLERDAALKQAQAELKSAEADLRDAELRLSYTEVRSPIDGRAGRAQVDIGDLVGNNGQAEVLTTVVKLDPIWVYIDASERIVQEYLERGKSGAVGDDAEPPAIEVARSIDPEGTYPFVGRIDFVDTEVDRGTGTVRVRGVIPNPDKRLFPGLFVRCRVPYEVIENAVLIEQNAVSDSLDGQYIITVDDSDTAVRTVVELGPAQADGLIVVRSGLEPGQRYVTRGIQKARPGEPVTVDTGEAPEEGAGAPDAEPPAPADNA